MTASYDFDRLLGSVLRANDSQDAPAGMVESAVAEARVVGQRRPIVRALDRRAWPARVTLSHRPATRYVYLVLAIVLGAALFGAAVLAGAMLRHRGPSAANGVIAYTVGADLSADGPNGNGRLAEVHLGDGTTDRVVRNGADPSSCAAFSPDGTRVAFWSGVGPNVIELVASGVDGSAPRRFAGSDTLSQDVQPAWSPDARKLAYVPWDGSEIRLLDVALGGSDTLDPGVGAIQTPRWSPDGTRIAFLAGAYPRESIHVIDVDGSHLETIVADQVTALGSWSPDGQWLAYTRLVADSPERATSKIAIVRPNGSGARTLTTAAGNERLPVWSPDSRRLAYVAGPANGYNAYDGVEHVVVAGIDGSEPASLPAIGQLSSGWYGQVTWSPDGRRLAVLTWPPVPGNPGPLKSSGRAQIVSVAVDDPGDQTVVAARLQLFGICGLSWQSVK